MIECTEVYLSKTCLSRGDRKGDLRGSSTYKCSFCHVVHDRKANAASNIFHMNMQLLGQR